MSVRTRNPVGEERPARTRNPMGEERPARGHLDPAPCPWDRRDLPGAARWERLCGCQPLAALPGLPPPSGAWGDLWPWSHSTTEGQKLASVNASEPVKMGLAEPHPGLSRTGSPARGRVRRRWPSVRSRSRPSPSPIQGAGGHANLHQGHKLCPSLSECLAALRWAGRWGHHPASWGPHPSGCCRHWDPTSFP